eukprot:TRINITY_DN4067_c0_g1_i1.p1 TRINITY_DN4067_c0_g1~~TRINITY_DN4067_c0_g1_i1.p1  ORF type:complete len:454 (+),score=117.33 TRINITY_DN4067_c0_g1_i1:94-1455(+)
MIRRPPRSTLSSSSAASDVYKRQHNFYPQHGASASDGIALLALGLGGTVVDGGACVRITGNDDSAETVYSGELQDSFMALDLDLPFREQNSLVMQPLSEAEKHGTLQPVGGVISSDGLINHMSYTSPGDAKKLKEMKNKSSNQRLGGQDVHGMKREFSHFKKTTTLIGSQRAKPASGQRQVVTMGGALGCEDLALKPLLKTLLKIGSDGFECPVEIEFAINLSEDENKPHEFVLLQTRPMSMWKGDAHHGFNTLPEPDISMVATRRALGNGPVLGVRDVVFIDPDNFNPAKAHELVPILAELNRQHKEAGTHYMLVCPGRIGTQQSNMGIPVHWSDINCTRCIVETDIQGTDVPPSEGTHFFQNLVAFGIAYFTVYKTDEGHVDYSWLKQMLPPQTRENGEVVRSIRFENPLEIVVDGVTACGVVMKPPNDFSTTVAQQSAFASIQDFQQSRL